MVGYYIDMVDVGEGDAFVISTVDPQVVCVIDTGPRSGAVALANHITNHCGNRIDHLVLTHVDEDHIGGAMALLESGFVPSVVWANDPRKYYDPKKLKSRGLVKEAARINASVAQASGILDYLIAHDIERRDAFVDDIIQLTKNHSLKVLSPSEEAYRAAVPRFSKRNREQLLERQASRRRSCTAENLVCVVLCLECRNADGDLLEMALFTADACLSVLKEVSGDSGFEWVKVPHHGSWNNLDEELVSVWCAGEGSAAALSCGREEKHGHPENEVVSWFVKSGARVRCTACQGTIRFRRLGAPRTTGWRAIESSCVHATQKKA